MTLLERYCQEGFVLCKQLLDKSIVQAIREDAHQVFSTQLQAKGILKGPVDSESEFEQAMYRLFEQDMESYLHIAKTCQHLISLHQLSLSEPILSRLHMLGVHKPVICTRPVMYFHAKKLAKSDVHYKTNAHQDWRSMQGSLNSMVVWIPLVDVSGTLGPLEVIPGSHVWGLQDSVEDDWYRQIEGLSDQQFVPVDVQVGDILFFSSFLIHRSGDNTSPSIRWSCHFRYNDLSESTFIERHYSCPYIYKPIQELLTPDFPTSEQLKTHFSLQSLPRPACAG